MRSIDLVSSNFGCRWLMILHVAGLLESGPNIVLNMQNCLITQWLDFSRGRNNGTST